MKKKLIFFISITFLNTGALFGAIGCMDNSFHTKVKFDHKQYHYVQCNCPCHKYINSFVKGECPECGHYHDPEDFEILTPADIHALDIQKTGTDDTCAPIP